jgi:hypothetical protein
VEIHSSEPKVEKAEKRGAEFALRRTGQSAVLRKPGYKQTAQTLREELLFQRAVQTYLWALRHALVVETRQPRLANADLGG